MRRIADHRQLGETAPHLDGQMPHRIVAVQRELREPKSRGESARASRCRRCASARRRQPHSSMSGFIGFLISTVTSEPFSASAISCTLNGLTVVRAPTQITSTPNSSAASTCLDVATSVPIGKPVISRARLIHASPFEAHAFEANRASCAASKCRPSARRRDPCRQSAGRFPKFVPRFPHCTGPRMKIERAFRLDVKRFHIVVLFALLLISPCRSPDENGKAPLHREAIPTGGLSFRSGPDADARASPLGIPGRLFQYLLDPARALHHSFAALPYRHARACAGKSATGGYAPAARRARYTCSA